MLVRWVVARRASCWAYAAGTEARHGRAPNEYDLIWLIKHGRGGENLQDRYRPLASPSTRCRRSCSSKRHREPVHLVDSTSRRARQPTSQWGAAPIPKKLLQKGVKRRLAWLKPGARLPARPEIRSYRSCLPAQFNGVILGEPPCISDAVLFVQVAEPAVSQRKVNRFVQHRDDPGTHEVRHLGRQNAARRGRIRNGGATGRSAGSPTRRRLCWSPGQVASCGRWRRFLPSPKENSGK